MKGSMTPQQKEDEELKKQHNLSAFFVQSIDIGLVVTVFEIQS